MTLTVDALLADLAAAQAQIAERDRQIRDLYHQVTHDPLTGLLNRRGLAEAWASDVDTADAVALIDLNRFKQINDTHGHEVGDQVLVHVARHLDDRYRIVARLGGDELVVIDGLRRLVDLAASWLVPLPGGTQLAVTGSVGLAAAVPSLRLSLGRADAAMYDAKRDDTGAGSVDRWWDRRRHPHLRRVEQIGPRPRVRLRDTRVGAR